MTPLAQCLGEVSEYLDVANVADFLGLRLTIVTGSTSAGNSRAHFFVHPVDLAYTSIG